MRVLRKGILFSGVDGGCNRIRRGGALSPPGGGVDGGFVGADRCVGPDTLLRGAHPRADTWVRPYAEWKAFRTNGKLARRRTLPTGRDGAGRCVQNGGVWSPRPTGATMVVPSEGPMWASAPTESPINHPSQPARSEASAPAAARDGRESAQRPSQKGDRPATARAALSESESAERGAGQIRSLPDD